MSPELTILGLYGLFTVLTILAQATAAHLQLGPRITLSARDRVPPLSPLLGRLQRCVTNGVEGLALFTPAVLVAHLSGQSTGFTTLCAWSYVAARALYIPAYALGLVPWRSLIWSAGLLATLLLLGAGLF